jgi:hypothetical protein
MQEPARHQALDPLHRTQGRRAEEHSQSGVRASAQGASWQLQALVQLSQGQFLSHTVRSSICLLCNSVKKYIYV